MLIFLAGGAYGYYLIRKKRIRGKIEMMVKEKEDKEENPFVCEEENHINTE